MDIKERIKNEYLEYLTEDEINNIDNYTNEDIPHLLNIIWNNYIEKNNILLVCPINILYPDNLNIEEFIKNIDRFKIITNDLNNTINGEFGFIIKIDWTTSNKLYLPKDLLKEKVFKCQFDILKIYSINEGLGNIGSRYNSAKGLLDYLDIPFISLDLHNYRDNYIIDYNILVQDVINYYLYLKGYHLNIELKEELIKKYHKFIINTYKKIISKGIFNDEEFINIIKKYLDEHENIKERKL